MAYQKRLPHVWIACMLLGPLFPLVYFVVAGAISPRWVAGMSGCCLLPCVMVTCIVGVLIQNEGKRAKWGIAGILAIICSLVLAWICQMGLRSLGFATFYHLRVDSEALRADLEKEIAYQRSSTGNELGVSFRTNQIPFGSRSQHLEKWIEHFDPNYAILSDNMGSEPALVLDYGGGFLEPNGFLIGTPTFVPNTFDAGADMPVSFRTSRRISPGIFVFGYSPPPTP